MDGYALLLLKFESDVVFKQVLLTVSSVSSWRCFVIQKFAVSTKQEV